MNQAGKIPSRHPSPPTPTHPPTHLPGLQPSKFAFSELLIGMNRPEELAEVVAKAMADDKGVDVAFDRFGCRST